MSVNYLILFITFFFSLPLQALEINPFDVSYKIFRNNSYIANSNFTLKQAQGEWVWRLDTRARGIYQWLTRKKPFIETRLQKIDGELKLLLETSGDYPDRPPKRSSWFDHRAKLIYSMKGEQIKKLEMPAEVYNFQSVHLLYPQMLAQNIDSKTIDFFKKGSLLKSTLQLQRNYPLDGHNKPSAQSARVDKMTQKFAGSKKYFVYYYQGDTLAPLKIEQINPGKDSSVMWRQD